jgi:DNA polymerase-3 subunit delta
MALITRAELTKELKTIAAEDGPRVFLFFGERFLCRKAVDELLEVFTEKNNATVYAIDGDQEDGSLTLAKLMSYSLLPGLQIYRINDTKLFHSKNISLAVWNKVRQAYEANHQQQSVRHLADLYNLAAIDRNDRQPPAEMTAEQWLQLFGLEKPQDLQWTNELFEILQKEDVSPQQSGDLAEKYIQSLEKGLPKNNILILSAESLDKRKKLFSYIKKNGVIVDCSVADGAGAAAQRVQKSILQEMVQETLQKFGKTMEQGAIDLFFERVGFHPVAAVIETEKLALYCDERKQITLKDLNEMVGRSREDALFELTDSFGKRQLGQTLSTLAHLLENGVHGLAILATMRNYIRKLLIFKSMQLHPSPAYHRGMNAKSFQENYLPQLKEQSDWQEMLKGHPYALYMSFTKAAEFKVTTLKSWLEEILFAEFRLKGSGFSDQLVLEQLIITLLKKTATKEHIA